MVGAPGGPLHDANADAALCASLKASLRMDIPVIELACNVNEPAFAEACAQELLRQIG